MLTKLFNDNSVPALFGALLVSFLLAAVAAYLIPPGTSSFMGHTLVTSKALVWVFALLAFPFSAWLFDFFVQQSAAGRNTNLNTVNFSTCTVLLLAFLPQVEVLLILPLLSATIGKLVRLSSSYNPRWALTDVGMLIGVAMCINPYFIWLLPMAWLAAILFGFFTPQVFFVPLVGAGFSYFMLATTHYLFFGSYFIPDFTDFGYHFLQPSTLPAQLWVAAPLALAVLFAFFHVFLLISKGRVTERQTMVLLLSLFAYFALLSFLFLGQEIMLISLLFPVTVFLSRYQQNITRVWLKDLVLLAPMLSLLLYLFL